MIELPEEDRLIALFVRMVLVLGFIFCLILLAGFAKWLLI